MGGTSDAQQRRPIPLLWMKIGGQGGGAHGWLGESPTLGFGKGLLGQASSLTPVWSLQYHDRHDEVELGNDLKAAIHA
jgi:hypothetical protein